jgi:hypothetical protein
MTLTELESLFHEALKVSSIAILKNEVIVTLGFEQSEG